MNSDDIKKYEGEPASYWDRSHFLDAETLADGAQKRGWDLIAGWGRDGYELGSWPYVIVYFNDDPDKELYSMVIYTEGDITQYNAPTVEERNAICDYHAHWYWRHADRPWVKDYPRWSHYPMNYEDHHERSNPCQKKERNSPIVQALTRLAPRPMHEPTSGRCSRITTTPSLTRM